jgi:hypothetical protein
MEIMTIYLVWDGMISWIPMDFIWKLSQICSRSSKCDEKSGSQIHVSTKARGTDWTYIIWREKSKIQARVGIDLPQAWSVLYDMYANRIQQIGGMRPVIFFQRPCCNHGRVEVMKKFKLWVGSCEPHDQAGSYKPLISTDKVEVCWS